MPSHPINDPAGTHHETPEEFVCEAHQGLEADPAAVE
jgi:hypothetical protein